MRFTKAWLITMALLLMFALHGWCIGKLGERIQQLENLRKATSQIAEIQQLQIQVADLIERLGKISKP